MSDNLKNPHTATQDRDTWRSLYERLAARYNDEAAVQRFADLMVTKMAVSRDKGRSGWQSVPVKILWTMLREHVEKGDPIDVANFAMMIWHHEAGALHLVGRTSNGGAD